MSSVLIVDLICGLTAPSVGLGEVVDLRPASSTVDRFPGVSYLQHSRSSPVVMIFVHFVSRIVGNPFSSGRIHDSSCTLLVDDCLSFPISPDVALAIEQVFDQCCRFSPQLFPHVSVNC